MMRHLEDVTARCTIHLLDEGTKMAFVAEDEVKSRAGDVLATLVVALLVDAVNVVRQRFRPVAGGKTASSATAAVDPQGEDGGN